MGTAVMLTGAFLLGKGHSAGFTALSFAPPLSIRCAAWAFAAFGAAILCPIYHSRAKGIHLFLYHSLIPSQNSTYVNS